MSSNTQSFGIKPSHKFINSTSENPNLSTSGYSSISTSNPSVETDSAKTKGNTNGMVIRTSSTAQEDFY
jgi:hypothetical protein